MDWDDSFGAEPSWEPESNLSKELVEDWDTQAANEAQFTPLPEG